MNFIKQHKVMVLIVVIAALLITVYGVYNSRQETESLAVRNVERVMQMSANLPQKLNITPEDHYKLAIPYDAENITYSTDDSNVAVIDEEGNIAPVGDGTCLAEIITDGIVYHTILNVSKTGNQFSTADKYSLYTEEGFNAVAAAKELETYVSAKYQLSVKSNINKEENLVETNSFTLAYEYTGAEVKYKLLSTLSYLSLHGYKNVDIEAQINEETMDFFFYATM